MIERLGNYQILERIESGALGTVYRAHDVASDTVVAIEILDPTLAGNSEFLEELQLRIDLGKLLDHPNITPVQDFAIQDGTAYLVMGQVQNSLSQRLISGPPLTWRQSISIALQVSWALDHAHQNGLTHLDIRPENILFGPDGTPSITGFGIASPDPTSAEGVAGNANYRSPEQWAGETLDQRTDLYSLGVTLYQMLQGSLPFDTDDEDAAREWHQSAAIPSFSDSLEVPSVVSNVVERAMQKSPDARFESAEAMAYALEDLLSGRAFDPAAAIAARTSPLRPINDPPELVPISTRPRQTDSETSPRRNRIVGVAAVALLVVVGLVAIITLSGYLEEEAEDVRAARSTPAPTSDGAQGLDPDASPDVELTPADPSESPNVTPSASGTLAPTVAPEGTFVPGLEATPTGATTPDATATPRPTPTPVFLDEYTQGLIYLSEGNYASAIFEFTFAIETNPLVSDTYEARGIAYFNSGEFLLSVEDYAQAISLNPTKATLYKDRADVLTYLGLDRLAILDYQKAVALDPELPGAYRGMGQAWSRVDIISVTEDLTPQGIEAFGQALRLFPDDFESAKGRALLNMRRGLYDAAIEEFTFLIDADPGDKVDTTYRRGLSYYAIGFHSQALTDADRIISLDLYNGEYFYLRSVIHAALVDNEQSEADAESDLETACALNPALTDDQIRLGAQSDDEDDILPRRTCPSVPADLVPTLEPPEEE